MVNVALLVDVKLFVWLARPNVYCSRFVLSLAIGVDNVIKVLWDLCWWDCCYFLTGVIKCLWELCCWVFGYCWGWCD